MTTPAPSSVRTIARADGPGGGRGSGALPADTAAPSDPTPDPGAVIRAVGLHKTYRLGRVPVPVLRGVDISIREREFVAVLGASGSGKSTLLHLLAGLDRPDRSAAGPKTASAPSPDALPSKPGRIYFRDQDITAFSARRMDDYRRRCVGMVFQFYHLLPELTVLENVTIAAMVRLGRFGYLRRRAEVRSHAASLLERFGLAHRLAHRPAELSGGERQRVAIARALVNQPRVLLADEPTGNLDRKTGAGILDALESHRRDAGLTLIMVTHDPDVASRADRIVELTDGLVGPAVVPPA